MYCKEIVCLCKLGSHPGLGPLLVDYERQSFLSLEARDFEGTVRGSVKNFGKKRRQEDFKPCKAKEFTIGFEIHNLV